MCTQLKHPGFCWPFFFYFLFIFWFREKGEPLPMTTTLITYGANRKHFTTTGVSVSLLHSPSLSHTLSPLLSSLRWSLSPLPSPQFLPSLTSFLFWLPPEVFQHSLQKKTRVFNMNMWRGKERKNLTKDNSVVLY